MQYEASIYQGLTWLPALVLMLAGTLLFIRCLDSKYRWLGLSVLLIGGIWLLLLPIIKGYWAVSRFDMMDHIGYTIDLTRFDISRANPYPLLHVIPALLMRLGFAQNIAVGLMPVICYLVYIASIYFLAYTLWGKDRKTWLATLISALLVLPVSGELSGMVVIFSFFPLFLGIYIRVLCNHAWHWRELFFLCALVSPFFHPELAAIMIIVILAGICLGNLRQSIMPLVVLAGMFCLWYWGRAVFGPGAEIIEGTSHPGAAVIVPAVVVEKASDFANALRSLDIAGFPLYKLPWLLMKIYGGEIILGGSALISLGILICRLFHGEKPSKVIILVNGLFICFVIGYTLYFVGFWFFDEGNIRSVINRSLFLIPCLAVLVATPFLSYFKKWLLAVLLMAILVFSFFNVYPSPSIYQPNRMVTANEMDGAIWFIENKQPSVPAAHLGTPIRRYYVALYGVNNWNTYSDFIEGDGEPFPEGLIKVPEHLGYDKCESIGEIFKDPTYLIITSFDKTLYKDCWKPPIPTRWADDDFKKLYSDPAATLVYQNPDFEVWGINLD